MFQPFNEWSTNSAKASLWNCIKILALSKPEGGLGKQKFTVLTGPRNVAGRVTPSKAPKWTLLWHSAVNCPRHVCWQSKRLYWEGAQQAEGTQEGCSVTWLTVSGFLVMRLVSGCLWPIILTQGSSWWSMHCSSKMDAARRILGGGKTRDISFWPSLNSCDWWWLVSSRFLTRTSCHKIIHANGYYGAWLVWVVSARMFPLTEGPVGVNTPKFQAWSV